MKETWYRVRLVFDSPIGYQYLYFYSLEDAEVLVRILKREWTTASTEIQERKGKTWATYQIHS